MAEHAISPSPAKGMGAWIESIRRFAPNIARKLQGCAVGKCESAGFDWCSWKTAARSQNGTAYECDSFYPKEGWITARRQDERLTQVSFGFDAAVRDKIHGDLVRQNDGSRASAPSRAHRFLIDKTTLLEVDRSSYWSLIKITPLSEVAGRLNRLWEAAGARDGSSNTTLTPTLLHYERDDFMASALYNAQGEVEALYTCIPVWKAGEDQAVFEALAGTWGTPKMAEINLFGVTLRARVFPANWYVVDLRSISAGHVEKKTSQLLLFKSEPSSALARLNPHCEADE